MIVLYIIGLILGFLLGIGCVILLTIWIIKRLIKLIFNRGES